MKHHRILLSEKQLEAHMAQVKQLFAKKPVSIKKAEKAITKLAIINACAYKGKRINKRMHKYNLRIYQFKSKYLRIATELFIELKGDVGKEDYGVISFRRRDGVQISFHNRVNKNSESHFKRLNELSMKLPYKEWDGILDSYKYTGREYANLLRNRHNNQI